VLERELLLGLDDRRWVATDQVARLECSEDVLMAVEERSKREVARFGVTGPIGSGKWMQLPANQRAKIVDIAGDWLAELGYIDVT
jgi:hypothetical protein